MTGKRVMAATASLLDETHSERVLALWAELENELGIKGASISPLPHFTYQASREFDVPVLQQTIEQVAATRRPVRVRTAGLAVFTGSSPVVYIPVVRSPELAALQVSLWSAGAMATETPMQEYHPARWLPHITLAQGDVTQENLGDAVARLNKADLYWEFDIDNLSIIRGKGNAPQELVARYELGGHSRNF